MAVEASGSAERQIVEVTWDQNIVTGDAVQMRCTNPDNGDVSVSGISQNDGQGYVTYPVGYSGVTHVEVYDGSGNKDEGVISVGDAEVPEDPNEIWGPGDPRPQPPIEIPELPTGIWGPGDPRPQPPIVIAPGLPPDFWTGNLPPAAQPVE